MAVSGGELELSLRLGGGYSCGSTDSNSDAGRPTGWAKEQYCQQQQQQQRNQITMFYDGKMRCVSNVTELQARAIICKAKSEMDETMKTTRSCKDQYDHEHQHDHRHYQLKESSKSQSPTPPPSSAPALVPQQQANPASLSLKRSLHQFLQKRKTRINAVSPYFLNHR